MIRILSRQSGPGQRTPDTVIEELRKSSSDVLIAKPDTLWETGARATYDIDCRRRNLKSVAKYLKRLERVKGIEPSS
jgi:hypothetical protein